ncbi:MAG: hypothetical protein IJ099_01185 [Alphaproteobacteria bacterium]|nr:hypothetical protein [Alphaproteobacteria bacterium]
MQVFAFFLAFFTSCSWLIYALMYVQSKLEAENLWVQSPEMMLTFLGVVFLPLLTVWMIFGYVNQYINNKQMNRKQTELLTQLQKNQDYTDLVVRVMLDAEHEIKDGFVINKFEVLINDMNEALSEIIQRCNIASSSQLEQLWQRVGRGERWTLGKAIIDASKSRSTFNAWVSEKVGRDKVFRGSLLEFCSRYQNLLQLLEKHDRDRVFIRMIETGVFGKVYSIIAPLSAGVNNFTTHENEPSSAAKEKTNDYTSVLKLATMAEPEAQDTIMNVDKSDEEAEDQEDESPKLSIFDRFKMFSRKSAEPEPSMAEQDPFFKALHNSFQEDNISEPSLKAVKEEQNFEPHLEQITEKKEEPLTANKDFMQGFNSHLSANINDADKVENANDKEFSVSSFAARLAAVRNEAMQTAESSKPIAEISKKETESSEKDNEDLVYPFGGWTDENNYGK